MDLLRRLASIALVVFSASCILAWAKLVNPLAFGPVPNLFTADDLPFENPFFAILGVAFGSLAVAYFVYPSAERDDDDD